MKTELQKATKQKTSDSRTKIICLVRTFLAVGCVSCSVYLIIGHSIPMEIKVEGQNPSALSHNASAFGVKTSMLRSISPEVETNNSVPRNDRTHNLNATPERCKRRLPKCIIIGTPKSGTSALITFLSHHPEISATLEPEELSFFSHQYKRGLEWYRNNVQCSYSGQIPVEKTARYFYCPKCPERIKSMDEDIKLLVIFKDPITRSQSHYAMLKRWNNVEDYFENELSDPLTGDLKLNHAIFRDSDYTAKLRHWLEVFNRNQIHVVDGNALEREPSTELMKVENFLEISPFFTPDKFVFSEDRGKYCIRVPNENRSSLADDPPEPNMACLGYSKGNRHPDIPPTLLVRLKEHFRPMNKQLFRLIGRKFNWGY